MESRAGGHSREPGGWRRPGRTGTKETQGQRESLRMEAVVRHSKRPASLAASDRPALAQGSPKEQKSVHSGLLCKRAISGVGEKGGGAGRGRGAAASRASAGSIPTAGPMTTRKRIKQTTTHMDTKAASEWVKDLEVRPQVIKAMEDAFEELTKGLAKIKKWNHISRCLNCP